MGEWWRIEGWPTAEEWQAFWAFFTAAIALAAAVIALRHYSAAVRNQVEQSRPFVVADFVFIGGLYACVDVTNSGMTGAYKITSDWSVRPVAVDETAQGAIDRALVDGEIPFLAPGRSIRFLLNRFDDEKINLPRRFVVTAHYEGPDRRQWSNVSVLDIDQWVEALVDKDPNENLTEQLKRIADASKAQREAHEALARAADSVNVYLEAGPRVQMAREKQRAEREARRARTKEFFAAREAARSSDEEA